MTMEQLTLELYEVMADELGVESSLTKAKAERDAAMEAVDANADEAWKQMADAAIFATANTHPSGFTTDDVWNLGLDKITVHDRRALGPRIRLAAKAGLIEKTGQYVQSERRHATPVVQWRRAIR